MKILDIVWPWLLLAAFWAGVLLTGAPVDLAALAMPAFLYIMWVNALHNRK